MDFRIPPDGIVAIIGAGAMGAGIAQVAAVAGHPVRLYDVREGAVVPDGAEGELVFTTLTKEGLPVIRYRTRDLTRLLPPTARPFRRMGKITGRSDDMLIVRGVNVFPTQIEELILRQEELAPQYEIELTREGHLDAVEVRVELAPKYAASPAPRRAQVAKTLAHSIKTFVGISTKITLMEPNALMRSVGKARRVFDKRPK